MLGLDLLEAARAPDGRGAAAAHGVPQAGDDRGQPAVARGEQDQLVEALVVVHEAGSSPRAARSPIASSSACERVGVDDPARLRGGRDLEQQAQLEDLGDVVPRSVARIRTPRLRSNRTRPSRSSIEQRLAHRRARDARAARRAARPSAAPAGLQPPVGDRRQHGRRARGWRASAAPPAARASSHRRPQDQGQILQAGLLGRDHEQPLLLQRALGERRRRRPPCSRARRSRSARRRRASASRAPPAACRARGRRSARRAAARRRGGGAPGRRRR